MSTAPTTPSRVQLYGLVLVGGESRRMGRDKALLRFGNRGTQLEQTVELLQSVCAKTFVSQRKDHPFDLPEGADSIFDAVDEVQGPLRGILSALRAYPDANWLVLACDLPNLRRETLLKLTSAFEERVPELTAYRSSSDGLPEPLCAIYPKDCGPALLSLAQSLGKHCPRKLLIQKNARLIDQDDPHSLDNINTAEEYSSFNGN